MILYGLFLCHRNSHALCDASLNLMSLFRQVTLQKQPGYTFIIPIILIFSPMFFPIGIIPSKI